MNSCCGKNNRVKVLKKTKHIVQGWTNLVTNKYKHTWWVKERAQICSRCVHLNKTTNFCKACGCYIPAKITVKNEHCPFKFWNKIK